MTSSFIQRGADGYDRYMGRWSRRLAPLFVDFAGLAANERVLDVGCGTGNLAFELVRHPEILAIECVDYEEAFVQALRERNTDPRILARQGDACALPFPTASFDRALSLLVLHFVSDPLRAAREMRRVVRPGGIAAAAVWDLYGGFPRFFWDTAAALAPEASARRAARVMAPMTLAGDLRETWVAAGFRRIEETQLTIRMEFCDFEDFWQPLMTGQGTLEQFLGSLPSETRAKIVEGTREAYLCGKPDGPRSFAAIAWAVKGQVPEG